MTFILLCLLMVVPAHASYGEYGGARMPHYGESFDDTGKDNDYRDSSSSLDNKFDDDSFAKMDDSMNYQDETISEQKARLKIKRPYPDIESLSHNSKSRIRYQNIEYDDVYDIAATDRNRKSETLFEEDYSDLHHTDETFQRKRKARDRMMTSERSEKKSYPKHSIEKRIPRVKYSKYKDKMIPKYDDEEMYTPTNRRPTRRKHGKEHNTEYPDYYDMKRIHNIKNRMPQLLRQTKEDMDSMDDTTELDVTRPVLIWARQTYLEPRFVLTSESETESRSTFTNNKFTTEEQQPTTLTTTTTETTEAIETTTTFGESTISLKELSMSEKSRLSIMRKALKKEFAKVEETKKPPILMKVTQGDMSTMVMVEPPEKILSDIPGYVNVQRAIEVSDDSPEMLAKVKKLMREKLVKGSKNINDIVNNWDEEVCDYIDLNMLLESSCSLSVPSWWNFCYVLFSYQLVNYHLMCG